MNVAETFQVAVELPAAERNLYLDQVCGDDRVVRGRVKALLQSNSEAGSFLDRPAPELGDTLDQASLQHDPKSVGPYKVLQRIGEGGMGVVFMAEQVEPVRRRVALKIIKPGMDSRSVVARFEAERQALAMMDHPNIAKVLDAGTTDEGHPYFVVELV